MLRPDTGNLSPIPEQGEPLAVPNDKPPSFTSSGGTSLSVVLVLPGAGRTQPKRSKTVRAKPEHRKGQRQVKTRHPYEDGGRNDLLLRSSQS